MKIANWFGAEPFPVSQRLTAQRAAEPQRGPNAQRRRSREGDSSFAVYGEGEEQIAGLTDEPAISGIHV